MSEPPEGGYPPAEVVTRVRNAFLIYTEFELTDPLTSLQSICDPEYAAIVAEATDGLSRLVSAASLPFHLTCTAVEQRRFNSIATAERIRGLKVTDPGAGLSAEEERAAFDRAQEKMRIFVESAEGKDHLRDSVVYELDRALESEVVKNAADELLVQALISTWSVFENFAYLMIIASINEDPTKARPVITSPDLKAYFGKAQLDFDTVSDYGFDLTRSMGSAIFRNRRLDNLGVIRAVMEAIFGSAEVRAALGDQMWLLNQRRHLFVHKRGVVDQQYLQRTGEKTAFGERLRIGSEDVERHLVNVRDAVVAVTRAARN